MAVLTKSRPSQPGGFTSYGSSCPESEKRYFQRVYGSDHTYQLRDGHQKTAMMGFVKPWKKRELKKILQKLRHLKCSNYQGMPHPGRSGYSIAQLRHNLEQYCEEGCRSLRWNEHYQAALSSVAAQLQRLLNGKPLQPISIDAVAESDAMQQNLDKNAGYFAFETGRRSKGENLDAAREWCKAMFDEVIERGSYGLPLVIAHRSSNSKPVDEFTWKLKSRVVLMEDIRALLFTGVFAIPFINLFKKCPWGEGSMTHGEVRTWVHRARHRYDRWFSSDYSSFDMNQSGWLLEDVFNSIIRPLFGDMDEKHQRLFDVMVYSYIHKEIHGPDGIYFAHKGQISGDWMTYAINTIVNKVITETVLLMQGCDLNHFLSLMCGDDNLTYYRGSEPWDAEKHCQLVKMYFGIETRLDEGDYDTSAVSPKFLSRVWTENGEERWIYEVVWNLMYPERYRDYDPSVTGVSVERAVALVLVMACLEQDATMREWFDVDAIYKAAGVRRGDRKGVRHALASLGTGFWTQKLRWQESLTA